MERVQLGDRVDRAVAPGGRGRASVEDFRSMQSQPVPHGRDSHAVAQSVDDDLLRCLR